MPDQFTPHLGLCQPEVGASRDTWGTKWNQNVATIDNLLFMAMPIGAILDFAGTSAPSGWMICDGRAISRVTYSKLFQVISTYWGSGDGSTTFNLPNMNGRAGIGPGAMVDQAGISYTWGFTSKQGFVGQTILQANLPAYNLVTDGQGSHAHGGTTPADGSHTHVVDGVGDHQHGISVPYSTPSITGIMPVWNTTLGSFYSATDPAGAHTHNIQYSGSHSHGIYADGFHAHNVNLGGGGQAITVLNPIIVVTKIIHAGTEAAIVTAADVASAPESTDLHREIENLREEITALRALFETPRSRMLSAPSRGPH